MKMKEGALALGFALLLGVYYLDAQSSGGGSNGEPVRPEPINLDIPPQEAPNPGKALARERAARAIQDPETFHQWVLGQNPGRAKQEQDESLAILNPAAYQRAHPTPPGLIQAQAVAAHAILNPHFPSPAGN